MLQLTDTQQCDVSVKALNRKGNPAPVQNPVWSSSDSTVATVTQDAVDGLKAKVVAGAAGTTQINVSADADMGDGVKPISAVLDVTVVGGQAVTFAVTTGTPTEQP